MFVHYHLTDCQILFFCLPEIISNICSSTFLFPVKILVTNHISCWFDQ